jgi:hypothetical protein
MATFFWRKQQIYVVKRTPEMLASLSSHDGELKDRSPRSRTSRRIRKNAARAEARGAGAHRHLHASRLLPKTRFTPNDATVMANWPGGSSAPAMVRSSTSPGACSRVRRRR